MDYAASWRATPKLIIGIQGCYWNDLEDDRIDANVLKTPRPGIYHRPGLRYQLGCQGTA